jgi:hypothetical protein
MTGYVYAAARLAYGDAELRKLTNHLPLSYKQVGLTTTRNALHTVRGEWPIHELACARLLQYPLKIVRSQYARMSETHERKAGLGRAEAILAQAGKSG